MIKLIQMMSGGAIGGAEGFFERLVTAFHYHENVHQKVVIRPFEDRIKRFEAHGIHPKTLPFGSFIDIYTPFMLKRYFEKEKPEIVMTWMSRATMKCPEGPYKLVARLGGYYPLKYYKHCDYLIGNTPDIVKYLEGEGFPKNRLAYLPNFVEERRGQAIDRDLFKTPKDAPLFLGLGRLHENKGFDVLIKALAHTKDAYLWIAGEGALRQELQKLASDLNVASRVRFLGWRRDAHNLLKTVDALVCSSRHEPLGNIVLEAWAQRAPIIAGDSQGPTQLIEPGELGTLYAREDDEALGRILNDFIVHRSNYQNMAQKAHAFYHQRFSKEKVLEHYMDFFHNILK